MLVTLIVLGSVVTYVLAGWLTAIVILFMDKAYPEYDSWWDNWSDEEIMWAAVLFWPAWLAATLIRIVFWVPVKHGLNGKAGTYAPSTIASRLARKVDK